MSLQGVTEVIQIDDDNEEDIEVVFSNLKKSYVNRNLTYRRITEEIKILQAMCLQHIVPRNYIQFKDLARSLGFHANDIIESAWQRVLKKQHAKINSAQNNKTPVCLVKPLQPHQNMSLPQAGAPPSSPHFSGRTTPIAGPVPSSSSPLKTSSAIPFALFSNKSTLTPDSLILKTGCSTVHPEQVTTSKTFVQGVNQKKFNIIAVKEVVSIQNSKFIEMETAARSEKESSSCNKKSQKRESKIMKSGSEESCNTQNSFVGDLLQRDLDSEIREKNPTSVSKNVTLKPHKKRRSSSKQDLTVDSSNIIEQLVPKSHIGVPAKIVRAKETSRTKSKKSLSKKCKQMSEAELKKFKAEQKRLKNQQKHELEMQQLQKVHDRLVDVLIPKYYNKALNEKG